MEKKRTHDSQQSTQRLLLMNTIQSSEYNPPHRSALYECPRARADAIAHKVTAQFVSCSVAASVPLWEMLSRSLVVSWSGRALRRAGLPAACRLRAVGCVQSAVRCRLPAEWVTQRAGRLVRVARVSGTSQRCASVARVSGARQWCASVVRALGLRLLPLQVQPVVLGLDGVVGA